MKIRPRLSTMSVNNEMDKEQNDFEGKKSERFNRELRFAGLNRIDEEN